MSFITDTDKLVAEQARIIPILREMSPVELLTQLRTSQRKEDTLPPFSDEQREASFYRMLTERELLRRMGA